MQQQDQWEYYTLEVSPSRLGGGGSSALDDLGANGWEAVGVVPALPSGDDMYMILFKRRVLEG